MAWIPRHPKQTNKLANLLNEKDLRAICHYFGGTVLYIPKCNQIMANLKRAAIAQDRQNGASVRELAYKYEMTDRGIRMALAKEADAVRLAAAKEILIMAGVSKPPRIGSDSAEELRKERAMNDLLDY